MHRWSISPSKFSYYPGVTKCVHLHLQKTHKTRFNFVINITKPTRISKTIEELQICISGCFAPFCAIVRILMLTLGALFQQEAAFAQRAPLVFTSAFIHVFHNKKVMTNSLDFISYYKVYETYNKGNRGCKYYVKAPSDSHVLKIYLRHEMASVHYSKGRFQIQ